MLNQVSAKISWLEIEPRVETVDDPHLVASSARSDVVPLFEAIVLAVR